MKFLGQQKLHHTQTHIGRQTDATENIAVPFSNV